jgi:hypothetical protein
MTAEAQSEYGSRRSSSARRRVGSLITACQKAARHRLPLWLACVILGVFLLTWTSLPYILSWLTGGADHEPRRWKTASTTIETPAFKNVINPSAGGQVKDAPIRYKRPDWLKPTLAVYSVPTIKAHHPRPTLRDLGDNGQAHAIDFLTKSLGSNPQSWAKLQEALTDGSESSAGERDPFQFDRILVATITEGTNSNPGDRMVWTRAFVEPINFKFVGYTVAATENETVKVTSVEATKSRKLSADIGLTIPGLEGAKASLAPSNEHTVRTSSEITAQHEKLGIDITPTFLRIIRESGRGGDVVGNTILSLSVVTDPWNIRKIAPREEDDTVNARLDKIRNKRETENSAIRLLVTGVHLEEGGVSEPQKNQSPITVLPQAPIPHCPLMARVWMIYEQRLISTGREFYDESRQTVTLQRDADEKKDVEVVSADDISPAVWSIQIVPKEQRKENIEADPVFVGARLEPDAPFRELVFTDYGLASKAVHWLRTKCKGSMGKLKFNYPGDVKNPNGKPSLIPVKRTLNECAENYDPKYRGIRYAPLPNSQ